MYFQYIKQCGDGWAWAARGLYTPQFSAFFHRGKEAKLGSPKIHPFLQPGYFGASVEASPFWNMSPLGRGLNVAAG